MSNKTVKIYDLKVTLFTLYALQSSIHFSTSFTKVKDLEIALGLRQSPNEKSSKESLWRNDT
jgi:hypothetical protein